MLVTVNGTARELPEGATVRDLLDRLEARAEAIAVERNRVLVRRRDFETTRLEAGDAVEIVTFVGGG
jgi:thiamine biosynthesis protein ThiS